MPVNKNILKYPLVAIVALLLAGLAAWYFFLDKQAQTITSGDSARGLGTSAPSFGSAIGSTYSNIVSGITALVGGAGTEPASKIPPQLWRVTKTPVAGMGVRRKRHLIQAIFCRTVHGIYFRSRPENRGARTPYEQALPQDLRGGIQSGRLCRSPLY